MCAFATSLLQEIARYATKKAVSTKNVDTAGFLCIDPPQYSAADAIPYLIPGLEIADKGQAGLLTYASNSHRTAFPVSQ